MRTQACAVVWMSTRVRPASIALRNAVSSPFHAVDRHMLNHSPPMSMKPAKNSTTIMSRPIVERVFADGEILTIEGNYADEVARVGPFDPADAVAAGEPAPIFGYAEPPTTGQEGGVAEPHGTKKHKGGVAA